ncbi:hypothetical protein [Myxococcus faecalis]|uniref:hypothetical protein n=1 Tax=Myxococcus faecalis TaxID=3115646 RepID=UPI003CE6B2A8
MFIETAEAALLAYEKRDLIKGALSKLGYLIRNGRLRVAVLGAGGTGKSTLAEVFGEPIGAKKPPIGAYSVSAAAEEARVPGVPFGLFIVGPGQERRRATHWPDIMRGISDGSVDGVIFLAAAGFSSLEEKSFTHHVAYRPGMGLQEWFPLFQEWALREELAALDLIKSAIRNRVNKRLWMVTLVNKQDLWWDDRVRVREWYQGVSVSGVQVPSLYSSCIKELYELRGVVGFEHEFASASFEIVNLATGEEGVIRPTVMGYDEVLRVTNLEHVRELLSRLCGLP